MVNENESILLTVCEKIMARLEILSKAFDVYFAAGELKISEGWIMNPQSYSLDNMSNDKELKEDLLDLRTNRTLEMEFERKLSKNIGVQ